MGLCGGVTYVGTVVVAARVNPPGEVVVGVDVTGEGVVVVDLDGGWGLGVRLKAAHAVQLADGIGRQKEQIAVRDALHHVKPTINQEETRL